MGYIDDTEIKRKALVEPPESMCISDLNRSIRILREELYQTTLRAQRAEEELARYKEAASKLPEDD
jgi:hypothetical protein